VRNEPPWSPEDHSAQVGDPWLRLVSGLDDARDWSVPVRTALRAHRAFLARFTEQTRANLDAREQLTIGARVAVRLAARFASCHPHPSLEEREAFVEATLRRVDRAMRLVAGRQQRQRAARRSRQAQGRGRPRRQPEPHLSVIDGWRWRGGGRPSRTPMTGLLLRAEIWRDVRAQARPGVGRVSRARALAEVLVYDLRDVDPQLYARIERLRVHYAEEDTTRDALVRAVMDVNGRHFSKLRVQFAQALSVVGVEDEKCL
jgi:hypothetical protein